MGRAIMQAHLYMVNFNSGGLMMDKIKEVILGICPNVDLDSDAKLVASIWAMIERLQK